MRISQRILPVFAALALLVTGLGSLHAEARTSGSSGCGDPLAESLAVGATRVLEIEHGGLTRSARVHLPPAYDPATPTMLVLNIHGYTDTAARTEPWTGTNAIADREGTIVVYPQATSFPSPTGNFDVTSWNDLACNASPGPLGPTCSANAEPYPCPPECGDCGPCNWCTCHDDVGYIAALLDHLEEQLCIDRDAVFAAGFSNGGMFVHRLGCALGERLTGVVPMAGALAHGFNCSPASDSPASSLLMFGGTTDRTVPHDGSFASDGYRYSSFDDVAARWAQTQGCASEPSTWSTPWDGKGALVCFRHENCASGATVASCTWNGAHVWPRVDGEEFGSELLWQFFEQASAARRAARVAE